MKRIGLLIATVSLASSVFLSPTTFAFSDMENYKIKSKGYVESVTIESTYDKKAKLEHIKEKHGVQLKGKFEVTDETFEAQIDNAENGSSFELEGEISKVILENKAYYYKGKDRNNDQIQFDAIVEESTDSQYNASINIYDYQESIDEPNVITLTFNGKDVETKEYTKKDERKPIYVKLGKNKGGNNEDNKKSSSNITPLNSYYSNLKSGSGWGYRWIAQGPQNTKVDAGNNISIRWGTDVADISEYWKNLGYTVSSHDIVNFNTRLTSNDPIVFNSVSPASDSTTEFQVPVFLGTTIGVVNLPVKANTVKITGSGLDDLLYEMSWNTSYYPSGYLDERSFDTSIGTKAGFGVRVFLDTSSEIETGEKLIGLNGYFKYRTLVSSYGFLVNKYKEVTRITDFDIYIIE